MPIFSEKKTAPFAKAENHTDIPAGLCLKCKNCEQIIFQSALDASHQVCPNCGYHYPMTARARIELLSDEGSFSEMDAEMCSCDPLAFADDGSYLMKLQENQEKYDMKDAILCGSCTISGIPVALGVMDFRFMGASMGSVVGEKVTRLVEYAMRAHRPLVLVTASGGARMQEGILSLMQMAKTSAALMRFGETALPYISVLTNPTTGGVTASFASLGDLILAEPQALIGFAGPRVIKQTTHAELPKGFQTAEFLLEHGLVDQVVPRSRLKKTLANILSYWKL